MGAYGYEQGVYAGKLGKPKAASGSPNGQSVDVSGGPKMAADVSPVAAGFGEAMSRGIAASGGMKVRGQTPRSPGKAVYREGPFRGLTEEQAVEKGKTMWAGMSDDMKNSYAKRGGNLRAPVEGGPAMAAFNPQPPPRSRSNFIDTGDPDDTVTDMNEDDGESVVDNPVAGAVPARSSGTRGTPLKDSSKLANPNSRALKKEEP